MKTVAAVAFVLVGALATATEPGSGPGPVVVVEVTAPDRDTQNELLSGGYDVGNVRGDVLTIYATPEEVQGLRAMGLSVREVARQPAPPKFEPGPKALGEYHNYAALTTALNDYATAYPAISRLYTLGQSVQGRELWAMLITDNPDEEEDEPEFKYVSTMHGDEPVGTELCLYLIDVLLSDYGSDDRITDLVDETAIWIVPLMNPDGLELGTRRNARGVDLNRNFPIYPTDFTGTYYDGEGLADGGREPETVDVMHWTVEHSFVLSANIHTGALVVNYPYDEDGKPNYADSPTPDDLLFEDISLRYSVHNEPMWSSPQFTNGITNGCAWYHIFGGMQDWHYRYAGCNEVTLELSNVKRPSQSTLPGFWADNEESMLSYMEAVHIGVRGLVTDGRTGEPVWAKVLVNANPQPVFTDPDVGDYHRMLLPGTYDVRISANGYFTQTWRDVGVGDGPATRVDVVMLDADIDDDGAVGATDIQLVINALLGYSVSHPCNVDGDRLSATDLQKVINALLHGGSSVK